MSKPRDYYEALGLDRHYRVSELWLRLADGERVEAVGEVVTRTLQQMHRGVIDFEVVIPR